MTLALELLIRFMLLVVYILVVCILETGLLVRVTTAGNTVRYRGRFIV